MTSHKEETVRLHGLKESMCGWENRFRSELTAGEKVDFRQRTWGRIQLYDIFSPRGLHISVVLILFGIDSPFFFFFFLSSWTVNLFISVHSLSGERAISRRGEMELAYISALFSLRSCKIETIRADKLKVWICAEFNLLPSRDPFVTGLNKELLDHHLQARGSW